MATNDVPQTQGLDTGTSSKKDPTGWASALNNKIDTGGTSIPTGANTTYAQLYQAIEADATKGTYNGTLWGTLVNILRAKGSNLGYPKTLVNDFKSNFGSHDAIALKTLLTQWSNANANGAPGTVPYTFSQFATAQRTKLGDPTVQVGPVRKITSLGTTASTAELINNVLQDTVIPRAKALGSNATPKQLQAIASKLYNDGTYGEPNIIDNAILANTDVKKTITADQSVNPIGGAIGTNANDARTIFHNYGIPVPQDPAQFADFIKNAVGPGGDLSKITEYAKAQALVLYPWMKGFLTGADGTTSDAGTVAGYLQPFTNNIASTLGIQPSQIDWTDPKWQGVVAAKDPKTGISVPQNLDQAIQTVKTDPRFGYDTSVNGINDAAAKVNSIKSMMGL